MLVVSKGVSMKQSEAVYQATLNVMGEQDGAYVPTKEERAQIVSIVAEGISGGDVDFSDAAKLKYNTPAKVKTYTSGMVSNWLRKDTKLNGGTKYIPANPGSRAGMSDPEVKNLKLLIKSGKLDAKQTSIAQARVDEKVQAIKAEKANVEIDFTAIPSDLLASLGLED